MLRAVVVLSLSVLLASQTLAADVTLQEVLLRAKPAVALVVSEVASAVTLRCAGGETKVAMPPVRETGTGWFIDPRGSLITNGHVVSPAYQPPDWLTEELGRKAARAGCRAIDVALSPTITVILSNGTRLPARVVKHSPPVAGEAMSGQDLALLRVQAADVPSLTLGDSADVKIGDRLHILGFPGVVLTHELLNASATMEATITNGAVSGFKQDRAGQPVIQTDAPAAWGNSGGPVIDDRGRVVGVLTLVSLAPGEQGTIVQGFNFVIPSQAVRDFVTRTEVALDARGRFNDAWHAALSDFFAGRSERARQELADANRLVADLPDVKRLMAENAERLANPPRRPFPWAAVAVGVTAVSAAGYAVLLVRRLKRNRFRIKPADVARMLESPTPPVILDVRDADAYGRSPVRIPGSRHVTPQALEAGDARLDVDTDRTVVAYCT